VELEPSESLSSFNLKIKIPVNSKRDAKEDLRRWKQENARVNKWQQMLDLLPQKRHSKLLSRGRKGIPDSFRGHAWCVLSDSSEKVEAEGLSSLALKQDKEEVRKLLQGFAAQEGNAGTMKAIHKDVTRTLPNHVYFQQQFEEGQLDLFVVLKSLSLLDSEIGYVQGLGYMVAILLTYVDREDAFNIMLKILNGPKFRLRCFYEPELPGLRVALYVHLRLLQSFCPRLVKRLQQDNISPSLYATQWFMTLFSNGIPLPVTLRVWDMFFVEGFPLLHRVAVAVVKLNEKKLLCCELHELREIFRQFFTPTAVQKQFPNAVPLSEQENEASVQRINETLSSSKDLKPSLQLLEELASQVGALGIKDSQVTQLELEFAKKPRKELLGLCLV
jgi:hypothetical protein